MKEGIVEGIDLDMDSKLEFCDVCVKAKATQKPFPKKSMSDRVKAYGDKVSTDVWDLPKLSLWAENSTTIFSKISTHMKKKSTLCIINPTP